METLKRMCAGGVLALALALALPAFAGQIPCGVVDPPPPPPSAPAVLDVAWTLLQGVLSVF